VSLGATFVTFVTFGVFVTGAVFGLVAFTGMARVTTAFGKGCTTDGFGPKTAGFSVAWGAGARAGADAPGAVGGFGTAATTGEALTLAVLATEI